MDPVSLIVAALVAGAVRSAEGVAEESLKDAYAGLKSLVKRLFKDKPAAEMALEEHEKDPATFKAPLEKYLRESGAAQDDQVLEEAKKLLALADPEGTRTGVYSVNVESVKADRGGFAAANYQGTVRMNYNSSEKEEEPDPS